jgi:hypothetical protein
MQDDTYDEKLEAAYEWAKENIRGLCHTDPGRFHERLLTWSNDNDMSVTIYNSEDILARVKADIESVIQPSISLQTWSDIDSLTFSEDMWRIKSLIPVSGIIFLAGISGERKTWLAFEIANALTTPRNFLHSDRFPVEGCNVLYVDCEMGDFLVRKRGRQLGFNDEHEFQTYFITKDALNLNDEDGTDLEDVIEIVKKREVSVVIVDTFRAVAGGLKEEKADEIRSFFNRFMQLKEIGVCVIFLDHLRKPNHFEGKVPKKEHLFASMDKVAVADVLVMMRTEPGSEITSVYQRKNRLAPEIDPFTFRMEDTDINSDNNQTRLIYQGEIGGEDSVVEKAQEVILEVLEEGPRTRKELISIVYKQVKVAERRASDAIRELEASQFIEVSKRGKENLYTLQPLDTGDVVKEEAPETVALINSDATLPSKEISSADDW